MANNISHLLTERAPWTNDQCDDWARHKNPVKDYGEFLRNVEKAVKSLRQTGINVEVDTYRKVFAYGQELELIKVTIGDINNSDPTAIITGSNHGYEPSGEKACVRIIETKNEILPEDSNAIIYPIITPSAWVINHRWNFFANDPNRVSYKDTLLPENAEEAERNPEMVFFIKDIINMEKHFAAAIDLHETPHMDIDLRIARAERYGSKLSPGYQVLPDGSYFYIGTETQTTDSGIIIPEFAHAVSHGMGEITPMAKDELIIGSKNHGGGITISGTERTLRHFIAEYANISITTEICPESIPGSKQRKEELAIQGQVGAIKGVAQHLKAA